MKNNKPIRHGEIMLVPVDSVPAGKTSKHAEFIVGHSETGHHHVLEAPDAQFEVTETEKNELFFRLFEPGRMVHKKTIDRHKDLVVQPGIYKRFHAVEYDPFSKVIRDVAD